MLKVLADILSQNGKLRNHDQLLFLKNILSNFSYFNEITHKLPADIYEEILKELSIEIHPKGTILLNHGI